MAFHQGSSIQRRFLVGAGVLSGIALLGLVTLSRSSHHRTELAFANEHEYLDGYQWEPPYPGAGPETPAWAKTRGSVGQGATDVMDEAHREHNILGNDYKYPDYARRNAARNTKLWGLPVVGYVPARTGLWVGSPGKMLPPDGDYPGGSTGLPEDAYVAYETGWGENPYHGEIAPMQEAGIMARQVYVPVGLKNVGPQTLSIMDPGQLPDPFNDWDLGNSRADLDKTYDASVWENPETQPIDQFNKGSFKCTIGSDCHDGSHQKGMHDNGIQTYDNYPMGSIDRNSPRSIHSEYAAAKHKTPKLALPYHRKAHK